MPQAVLRGVVTRTSRVVVNSSQQGTTPGRLLDEFVAGKDGAAFAELVRRLGPMVLGVCRRFVGDHHRAEDAFQTAFLVLARRAAHVRPSEGVCGWLYGVAVRCAQKARAMSAHRRTHEVPVPSVPDRAGEPVEAPDADTLRILDEELAALPEHLRAAIVLCELDGVGREDAAARLDIRPGTLSSRLARARKALAARLHRRGIALPATGLALLGAAAVPSRLAAQ